MAKIDYTFHVGKETQAQYNARIAAARGETTKAPAKTSSGPNYLFDAKNETKEQYNARIEKERAAAKAPVSTPTKSPVAAPSFKSPAMPKAPDPAKSFENLSVALNLAVSEGRKSRQDKTLDMLGGMIPYGALPASTFGNVVSKFNNSSAPVEASFANAAFDSARQADEQRFNAQQMEYERKVQERNQIRDLGLSLAQQGIKPETINAILASKDIDSAISASAAAMQSVAKGNEKVYELSRPGGGSVLVREDKDGNITPIYAPEAYGGGGLSGGGGGSSAGGGRSGGGSSYSAPKGGTSVNPSSNLVKAKIADVKAEARTTFPGQFGTKLITTLNDEELREFMIDFYAFQNQAQMSVDPQLFLDEWMAAIVKGDDGDGGGGSTGLDIPDQFK